MSRTALQSAYNCLLQRGRLLPDKYQANLVLRLAKLQDDLLTVLNDVSLFPGQAPQTPRSLYIYGSVGTGKSRLMDLFSSTLPSAVSKRRIHFHEFMMDIHSRLHRARSLPSYAGDPLVRIGQTIRQECDVLCFDEFQVTDIADAMILHRLFGSIWKEGGVVVSTSNRHPDELYENGLNRDVVLPFIREIQKRCDLWEIGGSEDYRMRADEMSQKTEVFCTDPSTFEERLEQALQGAYLENVTIPVLGDRNLNVSAVVSDTDDERFHVVTGTFEELCEAPLGSSDYHALCSATKAIFVSGLRAFRADEKDLVRRFITLIDMAYEKKVVVVCQSDTPLHEVFANILRSSNAAAVIKNMSVEGEGGASSSMMSTFIGETEWSATGLRGASLATGGAGETDVAFAIVRAISRLYEMGSKHYGTQD